MLAIVGGTGLYDLQGLKIKDRISGQTPFGQASGDVLIGEIGQHPILFLARHGSSHRLLPHEINYRANVFALKAAGATMMLGFSAVGSLRMEIKPGDLVMPEQYIDWTKADRLRTFFGGGVAAHISTAKPVSPNLVQAVVNAGGRINERITRGATYICVSGPRLGTQAESQWLRQMGGDLVGMTNIPEVFLAREAQMAYATLGMVTDYDCWLEDESQHVSALGIFELYGETLAKARDVLDSLLAHALPEPEATIRQSLSHAVLTADDAITPEQRQWLDVLRR
ncbi:MTAP family purine nucleoside phosphorylase [Orrella daihaiensis]|uniref:Purine nucleoside phosphorylase n=1 Tax=Orrella daihaiensis TaxID=2782176 RepID=A0ABY4AID1_9BURK|nr:MTAP family purine nucleoside phosphorylase [Orrella daihaiensis]UOD50046.1 MTAP family purine nucleoside phosphorylase [Orrella daihaiensis]